MLVAVDHIHVYSVDIYPRLNGTQCQHNMAKPRSNTPIALSMGLRSVLATAVSISAVQQLPFLPFFFFFSPFYGIFHKSIHWLSHMPHLIGPHSLGPGMRGSIRPNGIKKQYAKPLRYFSCFNCFPSLLLCLQSCHTVQNDRHQSHPLRRTAVSARSAIPLLYPRAPALPESMPGVHVGASAAICHGMGAPRHGPGARLWYLLPA